MQILIFLPSWLVNCELSKSLGQEGGMCGRVTRYWNRPADPARPGEERRRFLLRQNLTVLETVAVGGDSM